MTARTATSRGATARHALTVWRYPSPTSLRHRALPAREPRWLSFGFAVAGLKAIFAFDPAVNVPSRPAVQTCWRGVFGFAVAAQGDFAGEFREDLFGRRLQRCADHGEDGDDAVPDGHQRGVVDHDFQSCRRATLCRGPVSPRWFARWRPCCWAGGHPVGADHTDAGSGEEPVGWLPYDRRDYLRERQNA